MGGRFAVPKGLEDMGQGVGRLEEEGDWGCAIIIQTASVRRYDMYNQDETQGIHPS